MKCAIHQEESRKYVFKFMADSGEVFLKSEPYPYYSGCVTGARTVIKYSGDTTKSHQKKSKDDQFYFFEMEGDLEQTLGASPMYKTHEKRVWAIEQLMRLKGKTLEDLMDLSIKQRKDFARGTLNEYDYVAYQSEKDQLFYFELLDFSKLMFVSVPHENRQSCKEAILALKDLVPHAKSYRITKQDGGKYNFDVIDENKKKLGTSVTLYGREETGNMISVMAGRDRARIMTEEEKRLAKKRREDAERLWRRRNGRMLKEKQRIKNGKMPKKL